MNQELLFFVAGTKHSFQMRGFILTYVFKGTQPITEEEACEPEWEVDRSYHICRQKVGGWGRGGGKERGARDRNQLKQL